MSKFKLKIFEHGIKIGPLTLTYLCSDNKHAVLELKTSRVELTVVITPTGYIRIYDGKNEKRIL